MPSVIIKNLTHSIEKEEIEALIAEHQAAPHLRLLQKRLAKEVTVMVHSEEDYNAAVDASNIFVW